MKNNSNDSSIVNLKSELYKKQSELSSKNSTYLGHDEYSALTNNNSLKKVRDITGRFTSKKPDKIIDTNVEKSKNNESDELETKRLIISQRMLEQKAKLYDKLKRGDAVDKTDVITGEKKFLVDFERYQMDKNLLFENKLEEESKQLKKGIMAAEEEHKEKLHQKWDKLKERKKDVEHYQDVLFDELREHGVGYFPFSTDEEERQRQMRYLENLRSKTVRERERKERLEVKKKANMEKRLEKIRKRRSLPSVNDEKALDMKSQRLLEDVNKFVDEAMGKK